MRPIGWPDQTLVDAAAGMRSGAFSCVDVIERALAAIDAKESSIHAWVMVDRDGATRRAAELDAERARGRVRGPMHGIPVGVKDLFDVSGWPTRRGLSGLAVERMRSLAEPKALDSPLVSLLRAAGAVILGKTVSTPFAWVDPPPTCNPWNLERSPGGSSSGSAAAVSAGMCLAALGSQTGGSITRPAAYCGVAGWKPTFGLLNATGVAPLAEPLDHPGLLAGTVDDLRMARAALSTTPNAAIHAPAAPITLVALEDPLLAETDAGYREAVELVLTIADRAGVPIQTARLDRPIAEYHGIFSGLLAFHARLALRELFRQEGRDLDHRGARKSIAIGAEQRSAQAACDDLWEVLPEKFRALIETGEQIGNEIASLEAALTEARRDGLSRWLPPGAVFICPPAPTAPPVRTSTGSPIWNAVWSIFGVPTVTFPVGLTEDSLPTGVQLVGNFGDDDRLLAQAAWLEARVRGER